MSGGMMVLGGIVAAPIIFFAAKGAYTKAKKTREESEKLKAEIVKLTDVKTKTQEQLDAVTRYHGIIKTLSSDYTRQAHELIERLYPYGRISRFKRKGPPREGKERLMKAAFILEASGPSGSTFRFVLLLSAKLPIWLRGFIGL